MEPSKAILNLISESYRRLAVDAVVQALSGPDGFSRRELRRAIRQLVDAGELAYSYELGQSFLGRSFNRPVAVSRRITLTPPGHRIPAVPPMVAVTLASGAAFGYGQHPTTRMALKAIDTVLVKNSDLVTDPAAGVLDLGTGSGVLIIAGILLGMPGGKGIDIDPCALNEAARNVALNGLQRKVVIENAPLDSLSDQFALVVANLRRPTLETYSRQIAASVRNRGALILSGLKTEEAAGLSNAYVGRGFQKEQTWHEKGWAAIYMKKR